MPEQQQQIPSVGRIVRYYAYGTPGGEYPAGVARAAIITEVYSDAPRPEAPVGLCVLNPTGVFFQHSVRYGPGQPGCWGWLPYQPPAASPAAEPNG